MKKILFTALLTGFYLIGLAQGVINNEILSNNIKTVLMFQKGDDLTPPIWELGTNKKLLLTFDDLDTYVKNYYYTIIHCNSDWTPSDLDQSQYIEGYFEDQISDYQSSFNTTFDYNHYSLEFPNEYMVPTVSGNYILRVFENSNPDEILFNKRFMVVEQKVDVRLFASSMNQSSYFHNDQELEIKVGYSGSEFYNIAQNLNVQVLKNYNWINFIELSRPDIINGDEFIFNNFTVLKFKGGNEFLHFNTKNIHFEGENIVNISYANNRYHFQLNKDKDKTFEDYIYKTDINGLFKIDVTRSERVETEADYVYVYFTLAMDAPVQKGDIYVWGALSNFAFTGENRMVYNFEQKDYECRILLKQGYYNYQYTFVVNNKPDLTYISGNHSRTENFYTTLVYYHDLRGGYDRLIGIQSMSSIAK